MAEDFSSSHGKRKTVQDLGSILFLGTSASVAALKHTYCVQVSDQPNSDAQLILCCTFKLVTL